MLAEASREAIYDNLHRQAELRFPLEDYPIFVDWLAVPGAGAGLTLLDIACGQGFFLQAAASRCPALTLHGVDFSEVALAKARQRAPAALLHKAGAERLPFEGESIDYCVNLGSLEHFEEPTAALIEMRRVLKPTGRALIIVPNPYYLGTIWRVLRHGEAEDQGQTDVTEFRTINAWNALIATSGLQVADVRGYNGEHHIAWHFYRPDGRVTTSERLWRRLLNAVVKPLIPLNLAQCFVYHLRPPAGASR